MSSTDGVRPTAGIGAARTGRGGGPTLAVLLLAAACGTGPPDGPALQPVPPPSLERFEPSVRRRLSDAHADLLSAIAAGAQGDVLAQAYGRAGMVFHAHGLADSAAPAYSDAAALQPDEPAWPYYLGRVLRAAGDDAGALGALEAAAALAPDDLPALLALADLHLDAERFDEAEGWLRRAGSVAATSAAVEVGLGKVAASRRDHAAAARHFERALSLAPQATEAHYPLGLAYRGLGRPDEAAAHLGRRGAGRAPVDDPRMAAIDDLASGMRQHQNRGNEAFLRGDLEQARAEFALAVEADPGSVVARTNLAVVLDRLGRADEAHEQFRAALGLAPDDAQANFGLAALLASQDRQQEAADRYARVLAADPDRADACFNLANTLRRLDRVDEAAVHYRRAIELDPGSGPARLALALTHARRGRWSEAREALQAAHDLRPDDLPLAEALVRVLAAGPEDGVRDAAWALTLARDLVARDRALTHVEALAMALASAGEFDEAITWQEGALAAARRAGRDDLVGRLQENLDLYRAGLPCRDPWAPDDPRLRPDLQG